MVALATTCSADKRVCGLRPLLVFSFLRTDPSPAPLRLVKAPAAGHPLPSGEGWKQTSLTALSRGERVVRQLTDSEPGVGFLPIEGRKFGFRLKAKCTRARAKLALRLREMGKTSRTATQMGQRDWRLTRPGRRAKLAGEEEVQNGNSR